MPIKFNKIFLSYLLVFIMFGLAFIFGKNFDFLTPEQQLARDKTYEQQKILSGIYSVPADKSQSEIKNLFSIKEGQCGRLFIGFKSISTNKNLNDIVLKNPSIKILLSNNLKENQELGFYTINNVILAQNEKIEFCANADYSNLLFQKDENSYESSFEVSNVAFHPIATKKHDFNNLMPSIVGNTDFSNVIYQSELSAKEANKTMEFARHSQIIGMTFNADADIISGVDLKLEFNRSGGTGKYSLELREVSSKGREMLLQDKIAFFNFDKESALRELKTQDGIYHIPLASHLEKGKTYFIGINNEAVKFNTLNTLKIYGGNADGQEKIVTSIKGKASEKSGSLYLKAYGADYVKEGNEKVLTGAKFFDNGDSTGSFLYEQNGEFSDYLDLEQVISKESGSIFYDNIQAGISGLDEGENAFVYKINTVYPFTKLKIEAGQPGGEFTNSLIYYSFDNQNWQGIKSDWDTEGALFSADKNIFQKLLLGDRKTKMVYIKVTYDKNDAKEKSIHLFGLKNLKVNAELIMGK